VVVGCVANDLAHASDHIELGVDPAEVFEEDGIEVEREPAVDLVLAGEVLVDRALADLGLFGDPFDGDGLPVVGIQEWQGGSEDLPFPALELPLLPLCDAHVELPGWVL
jgi:hypothetical protein